MTDLLESFQIIVLKNSYFMISWSLDKNRYKQNKIDKINKPHIFIVLVFNVSYLFLVTSTTDHHMLSVTDIEELKISVCFPDHEHPFTHV